jgi:tetratricopeptide (TPR) repeat protein
LQIQSALLVFNLPTTGYYASNISKLQQELEKMTEMPEYALPENKIGVETSLARVYLRQKDYNRAIEYANKAIELNKGSFEAYHWRSLAYQNLGQTEAAARDKEMFEKLVPTDFAYLGKLTN